jgi:hypothetical protein
LFNLEKKFKLGRADGFSEKKKSVFSDLAEKLPKSEKKHYQNGSWDLPSHGESYADCGSTLVKGCIHAEDHHGQDLFGKSREGKIFVRLFKRTCLRAVCPICYEKWAGKEAIKAEQRLNAWFKGSCKKPHVVHVVVSPPKKWQNVKDYALLRKVTYRILRKRGVIGGMLIFHPYRRNRELKKWYWSPHFHVLCYGWIHGVARNFVLDGWIVKNLGIRKTIRGTIMYVLSHCGIHNAYHSVTWFGKLSYNKLHVDYLDPLEEYCPLCGRKLVPLKWINNPSEMPQVKQNGSWVEFEGWMRKRRPKYESLI